MSEPHQAATVLVSRGPGSAEVFTVRRSPGLRFFGGFVVFPGGRVGPEDLAPDPFRAAAVRELFEETGLLLARLPGGAFPSSGPELQTARRDLLAGHISFTDLLKQLDAFIDPHDLTPTARLVTPPFAGVRFDTHFFNAFLPPGQLAEVWPGELDFGHWTDAASLLDAWARGDAMVSPPTISILQALQGHAIEEAPQRVHAIEESHVQGEIPPIFFAPGVQMIPLRTLALPPATHTNAFLIGLEKTVLLDPGADDSEEQERLWAVLDQALAEGRRLHAVILTHHHPDHVGAAAACADRYAVPLWAHPWTAQALAGRMSFDRLLDDGAIVDLGRAPDGTPSWHLRALHTPGHAPGHLAFHDPHYRLLFAADMVSTLTSILVAPPDGNLTLYLDSLRRLQSLDSRLLLPSHGAPTVQARKTFEDALAHRARREEQLLAALDADPRTPEELAVGLYRGLSDSLMRFAQLQIQAGLEKLQREGRVDFVDLGWRLNATRTDPTSP